MTSFAPYTYSSQNKAVQDLVLLAPDENNLKRLGRQIASYCMSIGLFSDTRSITDAYKYDGFDPFVIIGLVYRRCIAAKRENFIADMEHLVTATLTRGTAIAKPEKYKKSKGGAAMLALLITTYKITTKTPTDKQDVTLNRLMASLPMICFNVLRDEKSGIVPFKYPKNLRPLCCTAAAAYIPHDWKNMIAMNKTWNKGFKALIKSKDDDEADARFFKAAHDGSYISDDMRKAMWARMGITTDPEIVPSSDWVEDVSSIGSGEVIKPADDLLPNIKAFEGLTIPDASGAAPAPAAGVAPTSSVAPLAKVAS